MKFKDKTLLTAVAIASVVNAAAAYDHHQHGHLHQHVKRETETVVINNVAIKYVFDGNVVPIADVCEGLANGTFAWDPRVPDKPDCSNNGAKATYTISISTESSASSTPAAASNGAFFQKPGASPDTSSSSAAAVSSPSAGNNNIQSTGGASFLQLLATNPGVNTDFPDGQLPCTIDSLTKYGAVPLNYLGHQGFTAIVNAKISNGLISGLSSNLASGGDGSYYSYACPAGYMKAQWPNQNSGQTVGGVLCSGGKFHLTNPNSNKLCTAGAGSVNVVNNLSKVVAVCNTDYPATEDETVPTRVVPGGSSKLAITDSGTYFKASGGRFTSAQYYLNNQGYDIQQACTWGSNDGEGIGNWAPVNLGLGTDGADLVYIGLFSAEQVLHDPANPGKPVLLDYNVKVQVQGQTCEYKNENGQGNFYLNGVNKGYLGQTFDGMSVPGATCAAPVGSDMTLTFY